MNSHSEDAGGQSHGEELEAATGVGVFEMIARSDAAAVAGAGARVRPPPVSISEFKAFMSADGALLYSPVPSMPFSMQASTLIRAQGSFLTLALLS